MVVRKALELSSNVALAFAREMQALSFSLSTFTLEIDGKPTLVVKTKWHANADELCRDWVQSHWDQGLLKGRQETNLPSILKIRVARSVEKAAYEASADKAEFYRGVKILKLVDAEAPREETQDSGYRTDPGPDQKPTDDGDPAARSDNPPTF